MQIRGGHYTQLLEGRSDLSVSLQVLTGLTARKNPLPQNSKLMECSEGGLGVKKKLSKLGGSFKLWHKNCSEFVQSCLLLDYLNNVKVSSDVVRVG